MEWMDEDPDILLLWVELINWRRSIKDYIPGISDLTAPITGPTTSIIIFGAKVIRFISLASIEFYPSFFKFSRKNLS